MKIICEHCGSSINIDKDSKCPNCKAPYKNNKDYIKLKKIFEKEKDLDLKNKEANIELKNVVKDTLIHTSKIAIIVTQYFCFDHCFDFRVFDIFGK